MLMTLLLFLCISISIIFISFTNTLYYGIKYYK
nr:MAG TPA: hypothetical protein [Bacteriophage sp.]